MKTYTTATGHEFNVTYATSITSGYGHKDISVDLSAGDKTTVLYATTDNMLAFDKADDLEGQERYEALFDIVASKLDDQIIDWISGQD